MNGESSPKSYQSLAAWRRCVEQIQAKWPEFLAARADRLRHGGECEKVAEAILEDLLTGVLDWSKGDLGYQTGYADIVLSRNLFKYLLIEVKRPGMLLPGRRALEAAVGQARRYADEQRVQRIAASDGRFFYAADIEGGGLKDRILVDLASDVPSPALWWISVDGIYRPCEDSSDSLPVLAGIETGVDVPPEADAALLHPKYQLPASSFAYVGNAGDPATWKLPYRLVDGRTDTKRLPKAIQALLSNYRGARVGNIPEAAIPDVLLRLAQAAAAAGKMPPKAINPAPAYQNLAAFLAQLGIASAE